MKKIPILSILLFSSLLLLSDTIDLNDLFNYADQEIPDYITRDNSLNNPITDEKATIGRVLFYDKHLSSDLSTSCSSCHAQEFAFSDTSFVSIGANDVTGRHSMRLVNSRFAEEERFFWDKRAESLEQQTTMPIKDHGEMGYSGFNGDPNFEELIDVLNGLDYYDELFFYAYGDTLVNEERMQESLAQFIRSIQSFDSKYDEGRAQISDDNLPFPNFTVEENLGKMLFIGEIEFDNNANRVGGGAGCASCHRAPEFDIDPISRNNGVTTEITGGVNFEIHRSPTLRDLFNPITGELNGPLMHNAEFDDLESAIGHYGNLGNTLTLAQTAQLDTRLRVGATAQKLNLTPIEVNAMIAFLKTLSGNDMYTNEKWSNPFDLNGNLEVIGSTLSNNDIQSLELKIFPNPTSDFIQLSSKDKIENIIVRDYKGQQIKVLQNFNSGSIEIDFRDFETGIYFLDLTSIHSLKATYKLVKI